MKATKKERTMFLNFLQPMFSWMILMFFGREAIQQHNYVTMLIVGLGLGGISQMQWRTQLQNKVAYPKGELISFWVGCAAVLIYVVMVASYIFLLF